MPWLYLKGVSSGEMAETRDDAEAAFKSFVDTCGEKYPKAAEKLPEDRDELLAFYGFPAAHWQSIRTTNPIESTLSTIRHRTKRSRGCLSRRLRARTVRRAALAAPERI